MSVPLMELGTLGKIILAAGVLAAGRVASAATPF
jgi:hypothetical protein